MSSSFPDESVSDKGSGDYLDEINVRASQKKRAKAAARLFQKKKDYKIYFDTDDSQGEKIRATTTKITALTTNDAKAATPYTPKTDTDFNSVLTDSDSSFATDIDPSDESTCGDIENGIDSSERSSTQDEYSSSLSLDKSSDHKNPRTNMFVVGNNSNNSHLSSASSLPSPSGRYSRRRSSTSSHRSYCSSQLGTIPETDVADKSSQPYIANMSNHSSMYASEFFDDDDDDDDEFYDRSDHDHYHERQHPSAPASAAADTASTSENDSDVESENDSDVENDVYEQITARERKESSGNRRMNVILLSSVGCFLMISLAIAVTLGIVLHTKHDQPLVLGNDDFDSNTNNRGNNFSGENSNIFTNDIVLNYGGD